MKYSIQSILYPSLNSNLDGISADIFFKGCKAPHCQGCHNDELKTFCEPDKSLDDIISALKMYNGQFQVVTLMGGEPLDQNLDSIKTLLIELRTQFPQVKLSVFTKYQLEQVDREILALLNYVKCGRYCQDLKTPFGSFLASQNQVMYHNPKGTWTPQWKYNK